MEYGLIANIDQFNDNKLLQAQQIQAINTSSQLNQDAKLKEIQKQDFIASDSVANVEKTTSETIKQNYEVVITNTNFGFNDSSKDFFVKATRGSAENQYPTEDMMKLKTYLMSLN